MPVAGRTFARRRRARGAKPLTVENFLADTEVPLEARVKQWRDETPGCAHRIHLNNAGAGRMPTRVLEAMTAHLCLEAEIGGDEAADARAAEVDRSYTDIASLLSAAPPEIEQLLDAIRTTVARRGAQECGG